MANILLVDDEASFANATAEILRHGGHQVVTAETVQRARDMIRAKKFDLLLIDLMLPDGSGLDILETAEENRPEKVVIVTGHPSIKSTIRHLHGPGLSYLTKPIDVQELLALAADLETDASNHVATDMHFGLMVGESPSMQSVYEQIRQVAKTQSTVLIMGESGTGKELIAKAIHRESERVGKFVAINCGGLTSELIGSELFGHEKGSFTGANRRHIGCFERAETGTLFLDEVSEMPIDQQPHLLRALETNHILRVGGEEEIPFTARVVAASNRKLAEAISNGTLREDLYFRLSVFPIQLPPLRERPEDIRPLAESFLAQLNEQENTARTLDDLGFNRLKNWHWPGNIRELKHTIHRCFIMTKDTSGPIDIPANFSLDMGGDEEAGVTPGRSIREVEKELIFKTLAHYDGSKKETADALGVSLKTLYNRLSEYEDED